MYNIQHVHGYRAPVYNAGCRGFKSCPKQLSFSPENHWLLWVHAFAFHYPLSKTLSLDLSVIGGFSTPALHFLTCLDSTQPAELPL